jgi:hypothetical protein
MNIEFEYKESPYNLGCYMIVTKFKPGSIIYRRDAGMADILNIERWEYRNYMENLFNGCLMKNSSSTKVIHFRNEDDAKHAVEWLNAYLVMNKLK